MLRIAIDASKTTIAKTTGTEYYARALIQALITINTEHELHLYFRDEPPVGLFPPSPLVHYHIIPFRRIWTHIRFAWELWRSRPDVTFVPAHTLPFFFPSRAVVTVHDLGYKHFPQAHPSKGRLYLDMTTRYSAWRAGHILADSQATADDLTRFYGTSSHKISVVYPATESLSIGTLPDHPALREPYFLFIGTLQPRKNIARIVEAYRQFRLTVKNPPNLVLAGAKGWLFDQSWLIGEGIYWLGYIDEADKGALYAHALALVFPSLYEGFGFPILEAMGCGTPVITSTTSSCPEVAGDAALVVNPENIDELVMALHRIHDDEPFREILRQKGHMQYRQFSWEAAARQVLTILEMVGAT
ncbi:MAG: glycosyltransferase family 1 protein [Phototrophicales bacterium]|nr:MAG: glycosyltransferase family 1 protein [Phototrophicales bacterium]